MNRTRYPVRTARLFCLVWLLPSMLTVPACGQVKSANMEKVSGYQIVANYPHDVNAFTQGLSFYDGKMYEGTGGYGFSTLRLVDFATGTIENNLPLNPRYFGEGITILDGRLYQLTWQNRFGIVYRLDTLEAIQTFPYTGEGWGLTNDSKHLILSDGTSTLRFLDPNSFAVTKRIVVRSGQQKIGSLNELEFIQGEIWANIWHDDRIVRISPDDGKVLGWIDLKGLFPRGPQDRERVLNGIAYDEKNDRIFVTGKNWPQLFEIKIVDRQ